VIRLNDLLSEDNILVDMEGSEIILYGDVTSQDKKWLAEDISLSVPGVLHISNRIQVVDH
jgi:osmotically-inducible protein OsmY